VVVVGGLVSSVSSSAVSLESTVEVSGTLGLLVASEVEMSELGGAVSVAFEVGGAELVRPADVESEAPWSMEVEGMLSAIVDEGLVEDGLVEGVSVDVDEGLIEGVAADVAGMLRRDNDGGVKGVAQVLSMLPVAEKEEVIRLLQRA